MRKIASSYVVPLPAYQFPADQISYYIVIIDKPAGARTGTGLVLSGILSKQEGIYRIRISSSWGPIRIPDWWIRNPDSGCAAICLRNYLCGHCLSRQTNSSYFTTMSLVFDEYGRPYIIIREQDQKTRLKGIEAQKVGGGSPNRSAQLSSSDEFSIHFL